MTQDVTAVDFFCGAGGTTTGAKLAGVRVIAAANHWPRAIETHNTNHPDVDHYLGDITDTDMATFPKADILFASPECKTHSLAYGAKRGKRRAVGLFEDSPPSSDEEERSRATMWDVCRYAERHDPAIVIVENVVEVIRWYYQGELYEQWLRRMHAAGYLHREVFLNSMVAWPTPQSRDRLYVVFWKARNRAPEIDVRPWCWCPRCEKPVQAIQSWKNPARPRGKYWQQYLYRCPVDAEIAYPLAYPAASAIDWSLPAPRIGDREKPLAEATLARIRAGLAKYGPAFIAAAAGNTWERRPGVRTWPITDPLVTQAATAQHALVVETAFGDRGPEARPAWDPLGGQTARQSKALVVPLRAHGRAVPADEWPWPTVAAKGEHMGLLVPAGGTWNRDARPTDEPMRARTSRETEGLVVPPFVMVNRTHNRARGVDEPLAPLCTADHQYLVQPPAFVVRQNRGGAEMSTGTDEPLRTLTAKGHQSLVTMPFLVAYRRLVMPEIEVDDCGFRMLAPHEIKRAMGFPDEYVILGNKREQVRLCGNAVTPPITPIVAAEPIASLMGRTVG